VSKKLFDVKDVFRARDREEFLKKREELRARIETLAQDMENYNELLEGS
jgi:hypothetical protein